MSSRVRAATHAGSWYSDDEQRLSLELDRWLDQVPRHVSCIGPVSAGGPQVELPTQGARVIIAPHAGYAYSGRAAGWAYRSLDMTNVQRVFILGPSHHHYLTGCALSQCTSYETPFGELTLDLHTIGELHETGMFDRMSPSVDEAEHSIEMHLPYIHKMLSRKFSDYAEHLPPLIPILVGNTSAASEEAYGRIFAPYLRDPSSIFIISSDFCHWGTRFRYTYYEPNSGKPISLRSSDRAPSSPPIHESIGAVDMKCVAAIEGGSYSEWADVLAETANTVCGRHPIGIVMKALELLGEQDGTGDDSGKFKFVKYERSSDCVSLRDSSVSYCSGFAVL